MPLPKLSKNSDGVKQGFGGVRLFSDSKNVLAVYSEDEGSQVEKKQSRPDLGCTVQVQSSCGCQFSTRNGY